MVFVDYEYMQISFKNRYGINPPVSDWYEEICEHYDVKNIYFFADFTNHAIKSNLNEIRKKMGMVFQSFNLFTALNGPLAGN